MDTKLTEEIRNLTEEMFHETVENRRYIHQHPELSFQEYNTSVFIRKKLEGYGIKCKKIGDTGLLATVEGTKTGNGKVIALRSDIDALPIQEENEFPFKSVNDGVMHACGHDVHAASLMSTAFIIYQLKSYFSGTVKFIFQPAEEIAPGGALSMIKGGVLKDPIPDCIFGQHTMPELEAGKVGIRAGDYMASKDEIYITIKGRGGHAATPHLLIDPITIGCELISALQQIISRHSNPLIPSVLSFGRFIGDGSNNVIPDSVRIEGSLRALNEEWREEAVSLIGSMTRSIVESMGATCDIELRRGYPVLHNQAELTSWVKERAQEMLGEENVVDLNFWTASEDFAYYAVEVPGVYYRLGVGDASLKPDSGLHTSTFNADEQSLLTGPGLMTYLTLSRLS